MSFQRRALAQIIILGSLAMPHAFGHDGHEHAGAAPVTANSAQRTWTFRDTGAHLHASFVSAKEGKVNVRPADGELISLDIEKLIDKDQKWLDQRLAQIKQKNEAAIPNNDSNLLISLSTESKIKIADTFEPFAKLSALKYRQDDRFFYVESNSMPDHRMMVGITAWQQQVPLPQNYFGENAWRIPLTPIVAKNPLSAKSHFFRGAIALAANGVPIFNPIKNDGRTDTLLAGELDEFGGHCGRADDYHYHIAPTHLQKVVGNDKPIAYALDGYPIYGYTEPDGSKVEKLDAFNGHASPELGYHYHATKTYPYLNGGFHGEVVERDGQVDPQPRADGVRPALTPLRGAKITGFESKDNKSFSVKVEVGRETRYVNYTLADNGSVKFDFIDGAGKTKSETYSPRPAPGNRPGNRLGRDPAKDQGPPPPRNNNQPAKTASIQSAQKLPQLTLSSSSVDAKGFLSIDCTCDGAKQSPAISWKDAPPGTKYFAVSLWHTAPDQEKSYWVVYNIPAEKKELAQNQKGIGQLGVNDRRRAEYDPMCSKGPGVKEYHLTVFALSEKLDLSPDKVSRAGLLAAIKGITLATGTLDFQYERKGAK